ncbi:MAG: terpene cyclase/mutase family protein [Planctomycetes bacterium]|nr:terpene cyclase/mutase family protein [Planctomycetota bacterium]
MKGLVLLLALGQADPGVDQERIEKAIDAGVDYLLKQEYAPWQYHDHGDYRYDDLVLYTLYHAGVDPKHEVFQKLLKNILETPLEHTYCVSLQAMFLSEFAPAKYQWRLKQCCQFLVDSQCKNGQWHYNAFVPQDKDAPTGGNSKETPSLSVRPRQAQPVSPKKPEKVIQIQRRVKAEKEVGDNSNSQYAALGLRACIEANVHPPAETLKDALRWLEGAQNNDDGWSYVGKGEQASVGSMTIGSVGCIVIYKHYLKQNWRTDRRVQQGLKWLIKNWTVRENPGTKERFVWLYYYLYAVERAGLLMGMDKFGTIDWYGDGAKFLLQAQRQDGSWYEGNSWGGPIKDTCFAILFLRRATTPLPKVATGK